MEGAADARVVVEGCREASVLGRAGGGRGVAEDWREAAVLGQAAGDRMRG